MTLLEAMSSAAPGVIPKTPFYALHRAKFEEFELTGELEWFQMPTGKDAARARRGRQMALRLKGRSARASGV